MQLRKATTLLTQNKPASNGKTLFIVFLTIFLDLIGFGIIIPIQPFFAESLGASPALVTLLAASFSFMQFVFSPVWGRLSDRIGRKPVMLASIFLTAVGYFLFGISKTLTWLFFARMLSGFGSANLGAAQAIIADSTTPETRAKGMGIIGAAFGLGFIFGPALGGIFSQISMNAPMFVAAALSLINLIVAFCVLPETLRPGEKKVENTHGTFSIQAFRHAIRHPNVKELLTLYAGYALAFSLMEASFGLFVQHAFVDAGPDSGKRAAKLTAAALIIVGITATIVQGGLIGRLVKIFGEWKLARFGLFMIMATMCLIPILGSFGDFGLFVALLPFMALGTGTLNPSLTSLLSRSAADDEQGGTLGLGQGLASLGRVGGPAVAGLLFELRPGAPFYSSTALLLGCFLLSLRKPHASATTDGPANH